ncbi:MAG: YceI family protein [Cryomorphaceae bacterium]|nr:YceI family protein [Cryomorphaceae bacterium]
MQKLILLLFLLATGCALFAQKMITREGYIKFYGETPMEQIDAVSNQAASVINTETNEIVFQVVMKSFTFPKALMQEHFNENYVESHKYPKAVFQGKIAETIDFSKPGTYDITIVGTMTLHGVEQALEVPAKLIIEKDGIKLSSAFTLAPADYQIKIPSAVRDKIAKEMEVTVKAAYRKM